jgi:hypothetical protein
MTKFTMNDQTDRIDRIIKASQAGDKATAQAEARQLNRIAESRGFGKDYWLSFCESMVKAHEILAKS